MILIVNSLYLLILPLLALGMISVGDRFTACLTQRSVSERLGLSLALGMAICAVLVTFLGVVHLLRPLCAWLLLLLFTLDGLRWIYRNGLSVLRQIRRSCVEGTRLSRTIIVACVAICVVNGWFCLSPEIRHDPFDYHLTAANLYDVSGRIVEIPWHVFTYMPKYGEMLYAFVLLMGPDILGKLLHWTAGVGVLLLTYALGLRLGGRFVGLAAVLLLSTVPLMSFIATTCYVDLFVAFWALAAVHCLMIAGKRRRTVFGSIFLGMVLGCKYVAWATVAAPVLIALLISRRPDRNTVLRVALIAILALIVASPWLVYNTLWTGNPTYPLLAGIFGRHIPPCEAAETFFRGHSPPPEVLNLSGYGSYLAMRLGKLASEGSIVFFSGFIAAALYIVRSSHEIRRFFGWIVLFSSLVFLTATDNHDGRFFFPTLALCAVLTGLLIFDISGRIQDARSRRMLIWGGYLLALTLIAFWTHRRIEQIGTFDQEILPQATSNARESVLRERFPGFELVLWGNKNLPSDALVLGLGYPLQRRYISKNKYGYVRWPNDGTNLSDPEQLARFLRRVGVTHIATPWPVLRDDIDLSILLRNHLAGVSGADNRILYALKDSES
ncbi:MAG: glycosyltransferase family 39 protein [bacterium]